MFIINFEIFRFIVEFLVQQDEQSDFAWALILYYNNFLISLEEYIYHTYTIKPNFFLDFA